MIFEIKHWNGNLIVTQEADSLRSAIELLVERGANLRGADLRGANLSGADLSDADTYYKVPMLHTKMLEAISTGGTLEMGTWHTCETTHCRAGWAIHLAGKPGRLLESIYGSSLAGALIHQASCPFLEKVPDFYARNEDALADIRACAVREQEGTPNLHGACITRHDES